MCVYMNACVLMGRDNSGFGVEDVVISYQRVLLVCEIIFIEWPWGMSCVYVCAQIIVCEDG